MEIKGTREEEFQKATDAFYNALVFPYDFDPDVLDELSRYKKAAAPLKNELRKSSAAFASLEAKLKKDKDKHTHANFDDLVGASQRMRGL
eukprot:13894548-Alexandrium_andersonii.AAC.1